METGKKMQGGQEKFSAPTEGRGPIKVENTQNGCASFFGKERSIGQVPMEW